LSFTVPPSNYTNYALILFEYNPTYCSASDHFCPINWLNYHEIQPPTIPALLTTKAVSSSQINLLWNASTDNVGVATYNVYRGGVLVAILGNVTSYNDIGLTGLTTYSYTVSACDAVGNCSAQSTSASATTSAPPDTLPPSVPTGLSATVISSSHINLAWTASTDNVGVVAYKIFSSGNLVATLGNVTSSTRTDAPSSTYSYTVSACDAAGNCSAQSAAASAATPAPTDTQPPTVPTGLTATAISTSTINLAWTASTDNVGVTNYQVYRSGTLLATLGNMMSFSDTGLRDSTIYSYTVLACDAAGNCSAQSGAASAGTFAITAPTLNLNTGWNLVGNSNNAPLDVTAVFTDASKVQTVWKWEAKGTNANITYPAWAFYAPSLAASGTLATYAAGKGYDVLTTINAGEGFWVNALTAFTATLPSGVAISSSNFTDKTTPPNCLPQGWSLIATGDNPTPKVFANAIAINPPTTGAVATSLTTLWAWDSGSKNWYFYAPSLDNSGGLTGYINGKGYEDFTLKGKLLDPTTGFWVNHP